MKTREIKFRAWAEHERQMYLPEYTDEENFYISAEGEVKYLAEYGLYERSTSKEFRKDWHLMQFTGLHDKNGVEVYEGDMVQFVNGNRGQVVFGEFNAMMGFYVKIMIPSGANHIPHPVFLEQDDEVIGNIYQHPDLLL
ncbi:YopX family protein [Rufibacter roseus]|uniref:YopX family protein n=1 Tax=Rufibacter roseus TaxID=1567108 RepID=A0ABW2DJP3_9BACT|nr:YopX family protein [Rufibacter roseus]